MKIRNLLLLAIIILGALSFQSCKDDDDNAEPQKTTVYAVTVEEVKEGKANEYAAAQIAYQTLANNTVTGTSSYVQCKSFFVLSGQDETDVYFTVRSFESESDYKNFKTAMSASTEATNYEATFNYRSKIVVKTANGEDFDFSKLSSGVVEIAVRTPNSGVTEEDFQTKRDAFFGKVAAENGYVFDREFVSIDDNDKRKLVFIGWNSVNDFYAGLTNLGSMQETADFFGSVTAEAYQACTPVTEAVTYNRDKIIELAINKVNEGSSNDFETARTDFVNLLRQYDDFIEDKRFNMFLDYQTFQPPTAEQPIVSGISEIASLAAYGEIAAEIMSSPEAEAYFATFEPVAALTLKPLKTDTEINIAAICSETGQVLEIAVRDISAYENFNQADYDTKRDAFLALLSQQEGFVQEYQWISADDQNYAVGMTVYSSMGAVNAIMSNTDFTDSQQYTDFMGTYPPIAGGLHLAAQ